MDNAKAKYTRQRVKMVDALVDSGTISSAAVISAMKDVPRHLFVPAEAQNDAYLDQPLSIGEGQTISAPHMVGMMIEALALKKDDKVLEIGTGSGYHACVIAHIVAGRNKKNKKRAVVYSVERYASLAQKSRENIKNAGFSDCVHVVVGDGSKGLPEFAPYDKILVACAAPRLPPPLIEQLNDGGRIIIPIGDQMVQDLILYEKKGDEIKQKYICGCMFVPMIGEYGFKGD